MTEFKQRLIETKRLILYPLEDNFAWKIDEKKSNDSIGKINLKKVKSDYEFTIFLDFNYQKMGYAYEATLEVLKYIFLEVGIEVIFAVYKDKNASVWKLLKKVGFQYSSLGVYKCSRKDFLKELFRREKLYITEDIDKDPYIKHLNDYSVLNIIGVSGSGKRTATEKYRNDSNYIVIDINDLYQYEILKKYFMNHYGKIPNCFDEFDILYRGILDCYRDNQKYIIIMSEYFFNIQDISILKGDILILRTCINTCYYRSVQQYQKDHPKVTLEELFEYQNSVKKIYDQYHFLNHFLDRIDCMEELENG